MKSKIILIGGGGHCHSVIDVIELECKFDIVGIIDKPNSIGQDVLGYKVIGYDDDLPRVFNEVKNAVVTVGHIRSNALRINLFNRLKEVGYNLPAIISPLAYVSKYASIAEGSVVMHHALVNANVKVGKNCIINSKALLEHDVVVEDHCHVSTAAVLNGGVRLREGTFYGSNATSKEGIQIERFVKAGSVIK